MSRRGLQMGEGCRREAEIGRVRQRGMGDREGVSVKEGKEWKGED